MAAEGGFDCGDLSIAGVSFLVVELTLEELGDLLAIRKLINKLPRRYPRYLPSGLPRNPNMLREKSKIHGQQHVRRPRLRLGI